jgi:hypothetical protein
MGFPAIFSNKMFSKNITSLLPKHRQLFLVFSSEEKTSIWGPKSAVPLLFHCFGFDMITSGMPRDL